jgi:uncharacterized protein (TIGR02271 family)
MAMHHDTGATAPGGSQGHLGRLNDLDEFKVADGYPDPRGWDVKTSDGRAVGKVDDLIVDTAAMRVRYLSVEVDRSLGQLAQDAATPGDQGTHTLLPIGNVELDDRHDDVVVNGYSLEQVAGLPRYAGGAGGAISREYESSLVGRHRGRTGLGAAAAAGGAAAAAGGLGERVADAADRAVDKVAGAVSGDRQQFAHSYDHDDYDDQRLYAKRRAAMGTAQGAGQGAAGGMTQTPAHGAAQGEQHLTLAAEQLAVGKRQTSAGEVELRKTVDTERVQEQVQLRHDEVSVERRPVTDPSSVSSQPQIGADEIRIPIMEEQVVMQKVLVPREEIIVRRSAVVENQTVGADVRRERLVVDNQGVAAGLVHGGEATGAGTTGAGMTGAGLTGRSDAGMSGAQDRATDSGLLDRAADKLDDVKDRVDGNPASRPGPDATDRRI